MVFPKSRLSLLRPLVLVVLAAGMPAAAQQEPGFGPGELEFFESKVRPLLVEHCYECHGPDVPEPKGGLRLGSRESLLRGGDTGPAVVPGKPEESLLIDAVNYGDLYQMPPRSKLPAGDIEILTRWVRMGAPWPRRHEDREVSFSAGSSFDIEKRRQHWCWQPVQALPPPPVRQLPWCRTPVDRFILHDLEQAGLQPAPEATRYQLIRRLSFDLRGIPPTAEEIRDFVADPDPQAYQRLVERFLASPQFGERWARHWMDLVRYAETFGHEFDYPIQHAWRYRDYLIRAFNQDVPYDQLVLEHIAGDLLAHPRFHPVEGYNESVLGTGFWFLGEATHAPVDVRGDEAVRIDNQIDVFGKTFLGLTIACARCHDHKFDAISTRDYYALAGFLQSSRRQYVMLDPGGSISRSARQMAALLQQGDALLRQQLHRWKQLPPSWLAGLLAAVAEVDGGADLADVARREGIDPAVLQRWRAALQKESLAADHPMRFWKEMAAAAQWDPQRWERLLEELRQQVARAEETARAAPLLADFRHRGWQDWFATGWAWGDGPAAAGQWDPGATVPAVLPSGVAGTLRPHPKLWGVLRSPTFTITHPNLFYRIAGQNVTVRLVVDGYTMLEYHSLLFKGLQFTVDTKGEFCWYRQAGDLGRYIGHRAFLEIEDHGEGWVLVDEIRFAPDGVTPQQPRRTLLDALDRGVNSWHDLAQAYGQFWLRLLSDWESGELDQDQTAMVNWLLAEGLLPSDQEHLAASLESLRERWNQQASAVPAPMLGLAMADGTAEDERVHIRGNHKALGPVVPRRFLEALGGRPVAGSGSGRLELARAVASRENPLTARVLVNRLWHHLMGRGIVPTVDNFGVLGEGPTHRQLLDWLARDFMDHHWSIKHTIRQIVLSSAYCMSSRRDEKAEEKDPRNRLWHRALVRRLEGEAIRDALLCCSGRLDGRMYGPSVPVHITPFMQGRGRPRTSGPLDGDGRRSLYIEVRRNFLSPMMLAFDTPIPFTTVGARNRSNVPAQALILMNDPFVIQACQWWAEKLLSAEPEDVEARIQRLFLEGLGRPPDGAERQMVWQFLTQQGLLRDLPQKTRYNDRQVWADLCHALVNAKAFTLVP